MTAAPPVDVVAAVIERDGRYLLGLRPTEKRHGGLWEFPGGKVDPGETLEDAMRRELDEEMALGLVRMGDTPRFARVDDGGRFRILFIDAEVEGDPHALEHTDVRWVHPAEMAELPLAPSDAEFAGSLAAAEG